MWMPSVFSVLRPAVGPSSSHTLGPIVAASDFRGLLARSSITTGRISVTLQGSLALTGKGHLTDIAVAAGLDGFRPEMISFDKAVATMMQVGVDMSRKYKETALGGLAAGGLGESGA
ncbi:MAG: serine dehydratase beta chain [Acidobacteriota bacterium]